MCRYMVHIINIGRGEGGRRGKRVLVPDLATIFMVEVLRATGSNSNYQVITRPCWS